MTTDTGARIIRPNAPAGAPDGAPVRTGAPPLGGLGRGEFDHNPAARTDVHQPAPAHQPSAPVRTTPGTPAAPAAPDGAPAPRTGLMHRASSAPHRTLTAEPVRTDSAEPRTAPAEPAAPVRTAPAGQPGPVRTGSSAARTVLVLAVIVVSLAVSVGAAFESFYVFERTAVFFGWPKTHAWVVMPLTELFLILGSAELALRILEGSTKLWGPRTMAYTALAVTLTVNVGYRVLTLLMPTDVEGRLVRAGALLHVEWWQPAAIAFFAAIIPTAQLLAVHVLTGRLRRMAENRTTRTVRPDEESAPSILRLAHRAVANRVAAHVDAPVRTTGQAAPAGAESTAGRTTAPHRTSATDAAPARTTAPDDAQPAPVSAPSADPVHAPVRTTSAPSAPSNVVEINAGARTSMIGALKDIYKRFESGESCTAVDCQGHDSWDEMFAVGHATLSQIEKKIGIGKRRSKPARDHAEVLLPWATIQAKLDAESTA